MPNVTINIPAEINADVIAVMQEDIGVDGVPSSLTGRQLLSAWLKVQLAPKFKARRRRANVGARVASEVAARVTAETTLVAESTARLAAEQTEDTAAEAALGGVS